MNSENISDKAKEILKAICIRKAVREADYDKNIVRELLFSKLIFNNKGILQPTSQGIEFVKQEHKQRSIDDVNVYNMMHSIINDTHNKIAIPDDIESFVKDILDQVANVAIESELTKSERKVLQQLYDAIELVPRIECMPRILSQLTKKGYITTFDDKVTLSEKGVIWILFGIDKRIRVYRPNGIKDAPDYFLLTPRKIIDGLL